MPAISETITALEAMRRCLPRAADLLHIKLGPEFDHWSKTLDRKILPRLDADFPLIAAICGGGSTGKSTLFNTIAGASVSPTGGRAGLNRRVLLALNSDGGARERLRHHLHQAFDATPTLLEHQDQLLEPGPPLYCLSEGVPHKLVLLDTPDIDTGAKGAYANRDLAQQSLELADLFIYIFTNATYNNLDNTNFIARMFTSMGTRPCYLVYRVYTSFSDDDVREHAGVVAANIYGTAGEENVLGIYRADEDNAVAADQAPMKVRPVGVQAPSLVTALDHLDTMALRTRLLGSMVEDTLTQGQQMTASVIQAASDVEVYTDALENAQRQSVQLALSHFPTDKVLRRFAQIWLQNDPLHIKLMRRTGSVIQWPMKTILNVIRHTKAAEAPATPEDALEQKVEIDLLNAANRLYHHTVSDQMIMEGRQVPAPPVIMEDRQALRQQPWQSSLESILDHKQTVLSWSDQLDDDLERLADDLRARMGLMDQVRQTFAALLNVIPATAAVTYILHTGDPVGAAGIKVKLTGLFGLHDLYALIAIPATAGMTKADRSQLEQLLAPLARTWLEHKFQAVSDLFEGHITGILFDRLKTAQENVAALLKELHETTATQGSSSTM